MPVARKTLRDEVKAAIQELGRKGGKKRAKNLTPQRRKEIAKKAAAARWKKK
jgi:general stress protein YciG